MEHNKEKGEAMEKYEYRVHDLHPGLKTPCSGSLYLEFMGGFCSKCHRFWIILILCHSHGFGHEIQMISDIIRGSIASSMSYPINSLRGADQEEGGGKVLKFLLYTELSQAASVTHLRSGVGGH